MEIIGIDSESYKELIRKIDFITDYIASQHVPYGRNDIDDDDTWVGGYEVCTFLRISERTLQRLRSNGQVSYSIISGKSYYQIKEIKRLLQEHLIKSGEDCLDDLINNINNTMKPEEKISLDR